MGINSFISGIKISYILLIFALLILSTIIILFISEKFGYIVFRLTTFFDPTKGDSFQTDKALAAIDWRLGSRMGEILKKCSESHTDYIIAVITEEFDQLFPYW